MRFPYASSLSLTLGLAAALALAACGSVASSPDATTGDPIDAPPVDVTLTVALAGSGTGTVTSSPAGIDCGTACTLAQPAGTMVTVIATADASSTFSGWSGGGCTGTAPCVVTLTADTTVTATFVPIQRTLTVTTAGGGMGTVTSAPAGIDCGTDCTEAYADGTTVVLTASPGAGVTFLGWTGGGCTGTGTCSVTLTSDLTVQASFAANNALVVTTAGTGTGTVTSSPAGINCGSDCSEAYAPGTVVALTATAASDSTFAGWSGACTGTGACSVTVNAATMVTATFTLNTYTLTVTRAGNGTGTVTSSPAGINCGSTCSRSYTSGTAVALSATAATGSSFAGWSGACTGTGACLVTMTQARSVTATFTLVPYTLTVTKAGTGTGTVTSSPSGISCGGTCAASFNYGTSVTLTATPTTGHTFTGWSGACTGTGTCVVSIAGPTGVTATFSAGCTTQTVDLYATQSVSIQYPQAAGSVYRDNNARAYNNPTGDCGGGSPCDITGWLHFDMTSIPDTASISAMTVNAYATTVSATPTVRVQYSSGNNWTRATVTQAALPRTTAQVGNPVAPTVNVYNAFPITISSRSWTADLVDNSLTFGLDNTNTAYTYAYFTGSDVGTNRPYLRITYCN